MSTYFTDEQKEAFKKIAAAGAIMPPTSRPAEIQRAHELCGDIIAFRGSHRPWPFDTPQPVVPRHVRSANTSYAEAVKEEEAAVQQMLKEIQITTPEVKDETMKKAFTELR